MSWERYLTLKDSRACNYIYLCFVDPRILHNIDLNDRWWKYAGPGGWNDPDIVRHSNPLSSRLSAYRIGDVIARGGKWKSYPGRAKGALLPLGHRQSSPSRRVLHSFMLLVALNALVDHM